MWKRKRFIRVNKTSNGELKTSMSEAKEFVNTSRSVGIVIIEVALCSAIGMLGFLGNALVAMVVLRCLNLRTSINFFILGLAITDIFTGLICVPITSAILVSDKWIQKSIFLCHLQGFVMPTLSLISIYTLAFTAINRYVCVVYPKKCKLLFTKRNSLLLIGGAWIFSIAFYFGLIVTKSTHVQYEPGYATCTIAHSFIQTVLELVFFVTSFCVIVFCYWRVFQRIRKHQLTGVFGRRASNRSISTEEIKISKVLVVVFLAFAICWVPIMIITSVDHLSSHTSSPRTKTLLCTYLKFLSAAVNPFIYSVMNRSFRVGYNRILRCRKFSAVTPEPYDKNTKIFRNAARSSTLWKRFVFPVSSVKIVYSPQEREITNTSNVRKGETFCMLSLSLQPPKTIVSFSNISQDPSENVN